MGDAEVTSVERQGTFIIIDHNNHPDRWEREYGVISRTMFYDDGKVYLNSRVTIDRVWWRVGNDGSVSVIREGGGSRSDWYFEPEDRRQCQTLLVMLLGPCNSVYGEWV